MKWNKLFETIVEWVPRIIIITIWLPYFAFMFPLVSVISVIVFTAAGIGIFLASKDLDMYKAAMSRFKSSLVNTGKSILFIDFVLK